MSLAIGSRVGVYEITSQLGEGGMGVVYRARDPNLKRDVAIKTLPDEFVGDPDRLARLRREARALASLNHPNIAHIYGLEQSGQQTCIVMELVEGETLGDRLRRGTMSDEAVVDVAKQIADALGSAHDRDIIHRDLKPENIRINKDGIVKVLDFGLAKIFHAPDHAAGSDASTALSASASGIIVGTCGYMSPEQARGDAVDKRTDVWAFGIVMYEMLCGRPPFKAESVADTLAAVLAKDPDWTPIPQRFQPLLRRCLQKDPPRRLHDVTDARLWLEDARPPIVARAASWRWPAVAAVLLVIVVVLAPLAFIHLLERPLPAPQQTTRFVVLPPPGNAFVNTAPVLSPDGRWLAFSVRSADGVQRWWVRAMDSTQARPVAGTENSGLKAQWSDDSRFFYFVSGGQLKRIEPTGESAQTLGALPGNGRFAINNRGEVIFETPSEALQKLPIGGTPSALTIKDESARQEINHNSAIFLPDGRHFLYVRFSLLPEYTGIYVGTLDARPNEQSLSALIPGISAGPSIARSDEPNRVYVLFQRDQVLLSQLLDTQALKLVGEATPVGEPVAEANLFLGLFSASQNGVLAYRTGNVVKSRLTWFDRQGNVVGNLGEVGDYGSLDLSPDDTRVALTARVQGNWDVWLMDVARGTSDRLTHDPADDVQPLWSPDGTELVYLSLRNRMSTILRRKTDGSGPEAEVIRSSRSLVPHDWLTSGALLYATQLEAPALFDLRLLPFSASGPASDQASTAAVNAPNNQHQGQASPDGRWILYTSQESGTMDVYVRPNPLSDGTGGPQKISPGRQPRWDPSGNKFYYLSGGQLMSVDIVRSKPSLVLRTPKPAFKILPLVSDGPLSWSWDVTANGSRFLFNTRLILNEAASNGITVILNWPAAASRIMPRE